MIQNVVIREIGYKNPMPNTKYRLSHETYVVKSIPLDRRKQNEISLNTYKSMNVIKIGGKILPLIHEWLNLVYRNINIKQGMENSLWIIFKDMDIEDETLEGKTILNEKRSVNAALRLFNILKYFLICRERIQEKNG